MKPTPPRCGVRGSPRIPRASFARFAGCASLVPSGSGGTSGDRQRSSREPLRVSDRSPVRRTARRLALRSGGVAVSRPCAVTAAAPSSSAFGPSSSERKGAVERYRETGGAERHAIGEPRVDVRASARSGGGLARSGADFGPLRITPCGMVRHLASSPSSRGRRSREYRAARRVHPRRSGERQEGSGPQ